jgi:hypothetical protein
VPLLAQGRVLGVLSLYDREDGEPFTLGDAEGLTTFAVQAAVAEKLRLATHRTPFCGEGADEALYEAKLQGRDRWSPPGRDCCR